MASGAQRRNFPSIPVGPQKRASGDRFVGVMEESNLVEGHQELRKPLVYGQSLTDPCLGWDDSVHLLDALADSRRTPQAAREQGRLNSLARVLKDVMIGLKG